MDFTTPWWQRIEESISGTSGAQVMILEELAKNATIEKFTQIEAAERQLDRAISLFLIEKDYISAVTLAGAAEGILGEALKKTRKQFFFGILRRVLQKTFLSVFDTEEKLDQHLNGIRNALKHFDGDLNKQIEWAMDLEAIQMIVRAVGSYGLLTNEVTKLSPEFFAWLRDNHPKVLQFAKNYDGSILKIE